MKRLLYSLVCLGCAAGIASAQEKVKERAALDPAQEAAVNAERLAQEQQSAELRKQMLMGYLAEWLHDLRKEELKRDEEVLKLLDASTAANKAMEQKGAELLKADAEGGKLLADLDDLQKKMNDLQQQQREIEKSLGPIRQRLGLQGARGEKGGAPAAENPEFATRRTDAEAARKALEDKITERIKADPEGAKLLQQRDDLNTKLSELRGRGKERKAERQP